MPELFSQHFSVEKHPHGVGHNAHGEADGHVSEETSERREPEAVDVGLGYDLVTGVFPSAATREGGGVVAEPQQALLDVVHTATVHQHLYPEEIVLREIFCLVAADGCHLALAVHHGRVVDGAAFLGVGADLVRHLWQTAHRDDMVLVLNELVNPRAYHPVFRVLAKHLQLPFHTAGFGNVVGVHACHNLVAALPDAVVEGMAQPPVLGKAHHTQLRVTPLIFPDHRLKPFVEGAVLHQHHVIGLHCL